MDGRWFLRLLSVFLILAVIAGAAYLAFNAGLAQGIAEKAPGATAQGGGAGGPYYAWPFWGFGWPFFGFPFFGFIIGIFILFLVLRLVGMALWGPRMGHWRRMHGGWDPESGAPHMFKEWHDRLHGAGNPENKV